MGDISIIARRLKSGHVQYGWSGNGGYFKNTGERLLLWYNEGDEEIVEDLFELGQLSFIGIPGSEKGGYSRFLSHHLTGKPHYLGRTEREIFSKIAFVDYGYFYDLDKRWYYIIPGPFRIKMPLELIAQNLNEKDYEFDFLREIEKKVMEFILVEYSKKNKEFAELLEEIKDEDVYHVVMESEFPVHTFWEKYRDFNNYFDDWIVVKTDDECRKIRSFEVRKKENAHIETIEW